MEIYREMGLNAESIAAYIAIATALFAVGRYFVKSYRSLKEKERAAEERLEKEIKKYEISSDTIPGRTDLGFFALLEISSLKTTLLPHIIIAGLCFQAFMTILLAVMIHDMSKSVRLWSGWAVALGIGLAGLSFLFSISKQKGYIERYEKKMSEYWVKPLEFREKKAVSALEREATTKSEARTESELADG